MCHKRGRSAMNNSNTDHQAPARDVNVIFGSGGSIATLAGVGAVVALRKSGLNILTIGGISGGTIPAFLMASNRDAISVVTEVLDTDFISMVKPKVGPLRRLWALAMKFRHELKRTRDGVYTGDPMREHLDKLAPAWLPKLWIVACCDHGQVLFTDHGVFKYRGNGRKKLLDANPASVGTAVVASCAIPGLIDLVHYRGEYLFDGALGFDGACPVQPVTRHFNHPQDTIVAIDVGEDSIKEARWFKLWWHVACGRGDVCGPMAGEHPDESEGRIVITPRVNGFHGLKFSLSRAEKWQAIIAGFNACVDRLEKAGLLSPEANGDLFALRRKLARVDSLKGNAKTRALHYERLFIEACQNGW